MDTRQKILNAAADLITEEGLNAVRTSKIARRAGIADGSLYRHFESKDILVAEVYKDVAKDIDTRIQQGIADKDSIKERFFHYWEEPFAYFLEHPERFILFETLDKTVSIQKDEKTNALEQSLMVIGQVFAEGQAEGIIQKEINPAHMIAAIYGALGQMIYKAHSNMFAVDRAALRGVLKVFWEGMT